jgi:hypothetical protein
LDCGLKLTIHNPKFIISTLQNISKFIYRYFLGHDTEGKTGDLRMAKIATQEYTPAIVSSNTFHHSISMVDRTDFLVKIATVLCIAGLIAAAILTYHSLGLVLDRFRSVF